MERNVGSREKVLRLVLGTAAVTAAVLSTRAGGSRWLLAAWGVANVATGLTRYCPTNQLFGIDNTRGHELVHFRPSGGVLRPRLARRLNMLQREAGLTFANRAA